MATLLALLLSASTLSASTETNVHKVIDALKEWHRCLMIDDIVRTGDDPESGTPIRTILKFEVDADFYSKERIKQLADTKKEIRKDPRVIKHFEITWQQKSAFTDDEEEYFNYKLKEMGKAHAKEIEELWQKGGPRKLHLEYMECILTYFGITK